MGTDRTVEVRPGLSGPFLALVAAQTAHSVEEYLGKLYLVFPPARAIAGFWAGLESLNGIGHLTWSLLALRYTPGTATAPLLLLLALLLARRLVTTASG